MVDNQIMKTSGIIVLPTDKFGQVYYGPRDFKQAQALIEECFQMTNGKIDSRGVESVVAQLRKAGFHSVATKVWDAYLAP